MKSLRWIDIGLTALLLAMCAYGFWERWSSFRSEQPNASVWIFAREESVLLWMAFAIGAGLMLAVAFHDTFDRMTKSHLSKILPFLIAGLSVAVLATAVLIWVGSTWAPLSIALAIGLAVYAAKAAGLEPKQKSDNLPSVES